MINTKALGSVWFEFSAVVTQRYCANRSHTKTAIAFNNLWENRYTYWKSQ